ncbi:MULTISPECIES: LacI family DNA-binding transcriptional regulator [Sphingobium]|jgi:LacI family transcriptional regulator|uniref:LacI family DNA-binding transcriptional regulator n=2 Tax=Pseudomonadota TaxID=1224 RepID=A0A5J5ICP7_9SPHN|nr:LacI family DNA-binding transcriptional regulator [Sphingobium limneticum]KAA9021235.1 LacI family DNA-binding transcriptional regulator [Sphingobium limneticum]KAA9033596.1 LacI family DNA-binding transcriptional regulator [Sphingobium limneticum]MBU0930669.1 LacI family DNA-binding transcriptional regulator [Alphaproteobacteria bacterium]
MDVTVRRRQRGVTIRAVAERAGVSAMTVSNVINGAGRAGAATIEAVQAAIADLGYVPNLAARRLAKARATTVGLIYDRRTPFLDAVLVGSLRATNAHGLQLILRDGEDVARDGAERIAQDLVRSGADALLLVPPFAEQLSGSAALASLGVPLATIATGMAMPDVTTVRIDNHAAMLSITQRVIANGHRRIAYIAGPDPYSVVAARLDGFRAALARHGLSEDAALIVEHGDFDYLSGIAAAQSLLSNPDRPTAIICSSDDLAAGVIAHAQTIGLRLPRDLTVTGFDDTILASRIFPPLTVVRQPVEEMAFRATQCLIAALGKGAEQTIISDELFDHVIVERQSVAAAPEHESMKE